MSNYKDLELLLKEYENKLLSFPYNRFYIGSEIQKGRLFEIMSNNNFCIVPETVVGLVDSQDKFLIITTYGMYTNTYYFYYDFIDTVVCGKKMKGTKNGGVTFVFKNFDSDKYLNFKLDQDKELKDYFDDDHIEEFIHKLKLINSKDYEHKLNINFCTKEKILKTIPWANDTFANELLSVRQEHGPFKDEYDFLTTLKTNINHLIFKYFSFELQETKHTDKHKIDINIDEIIPKLLNNPLFWDALLNKLNLNDNVYGTILKLKELLDHNVITLDEFNQKKKELLKI